MATDMHCIACLKRHLTCDLLFALQVTTVSLNFGVCLHMHVSVYVFVLYKSFLLHTHMVIVVFFSFTTVEKQKHQTTINHYANNDESNY